MYKKIFVFICCVVLVSKRGVNNKIKRIKNTYAFLLEEKSYLREKIMINILSEIGGKKTADNKNQLFSCMSDSDSEDLDIISYNRWLRIHF